MRGALPAPLSRLLAASDSPSRDEAWAAFLTSYSPLILRVARLLGGDDDAIMDRYAFALDQLRRDECRRLHQFTSDGRGQFTTWLVLVLRRLCVDEHRQRYGRRQSDGDTSAARHGERRNLVDLLGIEPELAEVAAAPTDEADAGIRAIELSAALGSAVARLDVADRLLLRLRFEDDLSVPRLARIVGAPSPGHVYRRLERVLASLRATLQDVGVEDSVP
ncbi:MAG TPA: sigma-70 family RNA polymerase sigma factor [Gemmatimonadaceae bacterium]|nr:sigma-70 family RNA polymerase sigma factor [Gemmatimonadaceae bacterium]